MWEKSNENFIKLTFFSLIDLPIQRERNDNCIFREINVETWDNDLHMQVEAIIYYLLSYSIFNFHTKVQRSGDFMVQVAQIN